MATARKTSTAKKAAGKKTTARKRAATKKTVAVKRTTVRKPKSDSTVENPTVEKPRKPKNPCRLISVFGPFNSLVLVQMPVEFARGFFEDIGQPESRSAVIEAVESEIRLLQERALEDEDANWFRLDYAAIAVELALQLEHPGNSATSKSMCARVLNETMDKLHGLAPAAEQSDGVDELQKKRDERRAAVAS